jgi:hypothetical protein
MRIGMMLRAYDEAGGVGVYTRNLIKEILEIDDRNSYVLFYRNAGNVGQFADRPNVKECVVRAPNKAVWDQISIPYHCWREKLDVVVHPKFTVPLLAPCKTVMVVHGADWFMPDQARFYGRWDVAYIRAVMPLYFKKAAVVISVSQLTAENFQQVLNLPAGKIRTVYFGPARHFKRVHKQSQLEDVKARYALPDRFILTLTKRGGAERKNLGQLLKSYARYHEAAQDPCKLVIGGKDCHLFRQDYEIFETSLDQDIATSMVCGRLPGMRRYSSIRKMTVTWPMPWAASCPMRSFARHYRLKVWSVPSCSTGKSVRERPCRSSRVLVRRNKFADFGKSLAPQVFINFGWRVGSCGSRADVSRGKTAHSQSLRRRRLRP